MTETLANGYSYESTQRELSNEYQHDRVQMLFENLCVLVLWTKVASALEGLSFFRARNITFFCQGAQLHLQKSLKGVVYRNSISSGFLQKFEGAAVVFKSSHLQLLSSPAL